MGKPPVKHLSFSQLELWEKCPRQWKFRYVDGMDSDPWLAAWGGSAFHRWVEDYAKEPMAAWMYKLYFEGQLEIEREKTDKTPQISQGEGEAEWLDLGVEMCRKWVRWQEDKTVVANELHFVAPLPGLVLPIKGYVDAVVDADVVDWKTGRKMPGSTQVKIYGAILKALGWKVERAGYYNARTGKVARWHELDYSLEDIALLFKPLDDGIQEGVFPPTPGYHCRWCPGLGQCPEGMMKVGRPKQ